MLLLKMPVEETMGPAATPLKRVGTFEVLPLPPATASGLAPRRLLVERTSTFGILTIRWSFLRCGPLGPCCLRLRLQLRAQLMVVKPLNDHENPTHHDTP